QAKDTDRVANAQLRLVASGSWNALSMPPIQVVLLDEKRAFELRRDEELKLLGLKPPELDAVLAKEPHGGSDGGFADLVPRGAAATGCPQPWAPARREPAGRRRGWSSGSPCCGTSRRCGCTPPPTAGNCPRAWPKSMCPCRPTRSPKSRSDTS